MAMLEVSDIGSKAGHVLLLYDSRQERDIVIYNCINKAIEQGKIAIFASLNAENELPKLESRIESFDKNLERGSLRIIGLNNCSKGAMAGDLSLMEEESKKSIENDLKKVEDRVRANGAVIVENCPEHLSMNEKFEECNRLEESLQGSYRSWANKGLQILMICPHLSTVLDEGENASLAKNHTTIVEAGAETFENKKSNRWQMGMKEGGVSNYCIC